MGDKTVDRGELFRQSIASDEARAEFASTFGAMINEVLPVETTVRSIFTIENLAPGAVPVYTSDVQPIEAWYLPKFGQVPQNIVEIEEVSVPTFELVSSVEWKMRDAKHARIQVADRAMKRLIDAMVTLEEEAGWATIKAAASARAVDYTYGATETGLSKGLVDAAFLMMESNRERVVTDIYVGPKAAADIRGWTQTTIDPVTQREIFVNAGLGSIYNATLHTVHFLDDDEAYFLDTRPNILGYMPIRDELQTFDDPTRIRNLRVGVIAYEEVGFVVMDNTAIVKAVLDYGDDVS